MDPIEIPLLRTTSVGLTFGFSDPRMVPDFLRTGTPPVDESISKEGKCLFGPLELMEAALSSEQLETVGMVLRTAWSHVAGGLHTVHFSFGRVLTEVPSDEFAQQCRSFLARMSHATLWSASCWQFPLVGASSGGHVLDFRFAYPSPVADAGEMRARQNGSLRCAVDVIAVYPAVGRQLRQAS